MLTLELESFKAVNDTFGHHVGDHLLQQVARRLEANVRPVDLFARVRGEEFNVLLEGVTAAEAEARVNHISTF